MSNPNPPAAACHPRMVAWIGFVALAVYAGFLSYHTTVVAGGADSSGYLNSAKLFASGDFFAALRVPPEFLAAGPLNPMHFLPLGFTPTADPSMLAPTYPSGLPLQFALAGKIFGWEFGPRLVVLGAAVGAVWLCYLSARALGLGCSLAAAGGVVLGTFPVFLFTSVQPLSDTVATAWSLAALAAMLRAEKGHRVWALAGGAAFAMAVLVRPSNVLLAPALLVLVGFAWRRLALFAAGGAPGAIWLAYYNHQLYGGALRSGYGEIFEAFALSYGPATLLHFAKWLALLLPAAVLVLPVIALTRGGWRRREVAALALGFSAITGCYLFYDVSHEVWWCLRFILPAVPLLILGALLGVEKLARGPGARWPLRFRTGAALGLAVWAVGNSWYWSPRLGVFLVRDYEQAYADGVSVAMKQLPKNAVVLSFAFSGSLYFHSDCNILRWDQMDHTAFARYAALARKAGRPIHALLFDAEEKDAFQRCAGEWTRIAQVRNVALWQLTASVP